MLVRIGIDKMLLDASQGKLALGVLVAKVKVGIKHDALWQSLQEMGETQLKQYGTTPIQSIPGIQALNQTYKSLGLKAENKGSNEALLNRVLSGKGLYQINTVVDANNFVSIASLRSVGSYDLSKVGQDIIFRPGLAEETYPATTQRPLKLHQLPVLCDNAGPFGSPTSDSKRALITEETVDLMTVIFSFDGLDGLELQLQQMAGLLTEFSCATNIQCKVVQQTNVVSFEVSPSEFSFFAPQPAAVAPSVVVADTVKPL